jgi:hypothetical protein
MTRAQTAESSNVQKPDMSSPHGNSPMRVPAFRAFWIAGLFSNLGSWIHLVAAAWLMTSLTSSAAPVALLLTSQAIGPALGGLLVALVGAGAAFALNAVSFLGMVAVALAWRRPHPLAALPAEHIIRAVRSGIRYVRHAPALGVVLVRAATYALPFAVVPALLAVVSRVQLEPAPPSTGFCWAAWAWAASPDRCCCRGYGNATTTNIWSWPRWRSTSSSY